MNQRILTNVAVFATLGIIMVIWAFSNVLKFDFVERPYRLTAEFASSPGLHPNFEVDYLGVKIGKIDSVRLQKDKVVVHLDIERGIKIPQGVHAAAARKSAVGEPVVELTPAPGQGHAPPMRAGTVIPVAQTSVPPKYSDLFASLNKLVGAIDPNDAGVLTHELAAAWSGRADSLRQIINGSDQLTTTFADNSEMLDGLTKDMAKITHVLAQNRGALGDGVDGLAALTGSLAQVRGDLARLRDRGPGLVTKVNSLLDTTKADLDCQLTTFGQAIPELTSKTNMRELNSALSDSQHMVDVLDGVIGEDQGQPVLNIFFMLTTKKTAALEFRYPIPQRPVNKIQTCPGGRMPVPTKQAKFYGEKQSETLPHHDPRLDQPKATNVKDASGRSNTIGGVPSWLIYVLPLAAVLVLAKVAANALPVAVRRRRGKD